MAIIYRTAGAWGAGKGSNLTAAEVDLNFWQLVERVLLLEESGIQPTEILSIDVVNNEMIVTMDDLSTYGPFTLPVAAFRWTDAYTPGFDYEIYDLFTADDGMYMVQVAHTAATEFDPGESNTEGDFYQLIFSYPTTHDIPFFQPGTPGTGVTPGEAIFGYLATRSFYFETDMPLSLAEMEFAPADATQEYRIYKNDTEIGAITFGVASTDGVFDVADPVQFVAGDRLRILRPDGANSSESEGEGLDSGARDLFITLKAMLGTL
jgi:hypothetical protein